MQLLRYSFDKKHLPGAFQPLTAPNSQFLYWFGINLFAPGSSSQEQAHLKAGESWEWCRRYNVMLPQDAGSEEIRHSNEYRKPRAGLLQKIFLVYSLVKLDKLD